MFKYVAKKGKNLKEYSKEISQIDKVLDETKEIKNMATSLFSHKEKIEKAKVETFKEAQKRNGLSNADIIEKTYDLNKMFYVCFYSIIMVFFIFIYFLISFHFLSALMTLVVIAILGANAFKFSFRFFQFKNKSLCPVSDWLNSRGSWIPKRMTQADMFLLKNEALQQDKDEEIQRVQKEKEEYEKFLAQLQKEKEEYEIVSKKTDEFFQLLKDGNKKEALKRLNENT